MLPTLHVSHCILVPNKYVHTLDSVMSLSPEAYFSNTTLKIQIIICNTLLLSLNAPVILISLFSNEIEIGHCIQKI